MKKTRLFPSFFMGVGLERQCPVGIGRPCPIRGLRGKSMFDLLQRSSPTSPTKILKEQTITHQRVLTHIAEKELAYNFINGPAVIGDEEALEYGLNCEALTHLMLAAEFGVQLPSDLRALEMFHDDRWFRKVGALEPKQTLDIFFFCPPGGAQRLANFPPLRDEAGNFLDLPDMPRVHLAALVDWTEANGEPMLVHANPYDKGIGVWPLGAFSEKLFYAEIAAVKRLNI